MYFFFQHPHVYFYKILKTETLESCVIKLGLELITTILIYEKEIVLLYHLTIHKCLKNINS